MKGALSSAWCFMILTAIVSGCATEGIHDPAGSQAKEMNPSDVGRVNTTGVESQDLIKVCDKMARGILSCPQIANAANPPCVVLDPVVNDTRFPISKDLFLDRISVQLIANSQGKVTFLSRDRMDALIRERDLKRDGQVTSSTDANVQEFKGADFILTGKLTGLSTSSSTGDSEYILYSFKLIDARTSAIVWGDMVEIKKQGLDDSVYR